MGFPKVFWSQVHFDVWKRMRVIENVKFEGYLVDIEVSKRRLVSRELRRYFALSFIIGPQQLFSSFVDTGWRRFILDTNRYVSFSDKAFGHYLHYPPRGRPNFSYASAKSFGIWYRSFFGILPPDIWDRYHESINSNVLQNIKSELTS